MRASRVRFVGAVVALGAVAGACSSFSESDAPNADAGATASDAATADATPTEDGGAHADAAPFTCESAPSLFPHVADAGPFCKGAAQGNHCAFGQHCCVNAAGGQTCAATCPTDSLDIACYSKAECANGNSCCGDVGAITAAGSVCSYPVLFGFTGTTCAMGCTGRQVVQCEDSTGCSGKTCTPTRPARLDDAGTALVVIGTCF